jgi:hypothetical protein
MKAILIKANNRYYLEQIPSKGVSGSVLEGMIGSTDGEGYYKLAKQNCDEIFGVIDVEKLAEEWVFEKNGHKWSNNDDSAGDNYASFKEGFNKAMELNKDKRFTSRNMLRAYMEGTNDGTEFESMMDYDSEDNAEAYEFAKEAEKEFIKSLQQPTEIEVEIEMDAIPADRAPNGWDIFPKLDSEGCLILKK